jgi:hypothetical protein
LAVPVSQCGAVFTCIHLYSPVFTCIHLYSPVFTCIHLYSPAHREGEAQAPMLAVPVSQCGAGYKETTARFDLLRFDFTAPVAEVTSK